MKHNSKSPKSIRGILGETYLTISLIIFIPVVFLFLIALIMPLRYNLLIENMEYAILLRENAYSSLKKEVWEIVSGQKEFNEGRQYTILQENEKQLASLYNYNNQTSQYLEAAIYGNSTIMVYVDTLDMQMCTNMAVSYQISTYQEIIDVVNLIDEVLQLYINECTSAITELNHILRNITFLALAMVVLLILLIIQYLYRSLGRVNETIRQPIIKLEDMAIQIAGGNLDASLEEAEILELEHLVNNLNIMARQIHTYIEKEVEHQHLLQKAQMRALQEQIKPHFIYNTLDTIVWLAEEQDNDRVIDVTMAFTDYLRLALNQGNDYTTVETEIQHVKSYLAIQSVRYSSKMSYEVDIDPEIYPYPILKLLLQPLVENSIYHGIKKKHTRGTIRISGGFKNPDTIYFMVEDSGIGMTPEQLASLKKRLDNSYSGKDTSVGLLNVNRRLHLYYQCSGIVIESVYGEGTQVSFEIPLNEAAHLSI